MKHLYEKGHPKYGGRQKGSKNKRSEALVEEIRKSGELPLEFLLKVMRGEVIYKPGSKEQELITMEMRMEAAKTAAPYLHAKRAAEDGDGKPAMPMIVYTHPNLEEDEDDEEETVHEPGRIGFHEAHNFDCSGSTPASGFSFTGWHKG